MPKQCKSLKKARFVFISPSISKDGLIAWLIRGFLKRTTKQCFPKKFFAETFLSVVFISTFALGSAFSKHNIIRVHSLFVCNSRLLMECSIYLCCVVKLCIETKLFFRNIKIANI